MGGLNDSLSVSAAKQTWIKLFVASEGRTMNFERRLRALEARMITDPVILHFADGSTRELRGPGDFLPRLFPGVFGEANLSPGQAAQLDLIRQSVGSKEPGGGRLVELLQCFLHAQAEARDSIAPVGS
jgi:hypothetical protein